MRASQTHVRLQSTKRQRRAFQDQVTHRFASHDVEATEGAACWARRRAATISARIDSAISSVEIAPISRPAGALIAVSPSMGTPSAANSRRSVSAFRRDPTNAR